MASEPCRASITYSVSKTAQKPEDAWIATRVRELTKLVSKVKMSNSVVILRPVCLEEVVVLTTFDAFSGQERKGVVKDHS